MKESRRTRRETKGRGVGTVVDGATVKDNRINENQEKNMATKW